MKRQIKYPDLQPWFKEGLFVRRNFNGVYFSVGKQMWYVNKLRTEFFTHDGVGCIWNLGQVSGGGDGFSSMERNGWKKAKILDGFNYVHPRELRDPMRAMILSDIDMLPKAHDIAQYSDFAWEQFKYDFARGLFDMLSNKVGLYA